MAYQDFKAKVGFSGKTPARGRSFLKTHRQFSDPFAILQAFSALTDRRTCGDGEREAASWVRKRFEALGLYAQEDRFLCNPSMFRPHMMVFLFVVSLGLFPFWFSSQRVGLFFAALGAFYARKVYTDVLESKPNFIYALLPKKRCQNVFAKLPPKGEVRNRIVLTSHLDSAICSPIFSDKMVKSLRTNIKIDRFLFVTLGTLYAAAAVTGYDLLYYAGLLLSLYVVGSLFVLVFSEMFSPVSPGANDNGTGVAAVLAFAEALQKDPLENTEVWFACLGAEESGSHGSKAFWKNYHEVLSKSYILNIDTIGVGSPRYIVEEGYQEGIKASSELVELIDKLAEQNPDLDLKPISLRESGAFTDATHWLRKGCHAISFAATDDNGFIKNWHTPADSIQGINVATFNKVIFAIDQLITELDENYSSLHNFREMNRGRLRPSEKKKKSFIQAFKEQPYLKIIGPRRIRQPDFNLSEYVWKDFDEQATHVFETTAYLQSMAKSSQVPCGFIVLRDEMGEPILLAPFFVYYELLDDGGIMGKAGQVLRWLKEKTLHFGLPVIPGFKTLFIGQPYAQPTNQIFVRKPYQLNNLFERQVNYLRLYRQALIRLQLHYLAPVVSHFCFPETPENNAFLGALGFNPYPCWPDMYLDFTAIRPKLRDRLVEMKDHAEETVHHIETKIQDLRAAEQNLLPRLEMDPRVNFRQFQKLLLAAADAQERNDRMTESLRRGTYIESLYEKLESSRRLRDEACVGFITLAPEVQELVRFISTQKDDLKIVQKRQKDTQREQKILKDRLVQLVQKSLCNKFSGELPCEINDLNIDRLMQFFLSYKTSMEMEGALPLEWAEIKPADLQRRLFDLEAAKKERDEVSRRSAEIQNRIVEIESLIESTVEHLRTLYGENTKSELQNLLRAHRESIEIEKLKERIAFEEAFLQKNKNIKTGEIDPLLGETPERLRLQSVLKEDKSRELFKKMEGISEWDALPEDFRQWLLELAAIRRKLSKTSLEGAVKQFQDLQTEIDIFDAVDKPPTFDDYVRSLGENERNAMNRNLNKITETQGVYPVEIIRDKDRLMDIVDLLHPAYDSQYTAYTVQWLRMTAEYFRQLAKLPKTEVLVCWFIEGQQRHFAGFIINLDDAFNHRMGIMPQFRRKLSGSAEGEDDHLIYFRLTLENISRNLNSGKPGMWIAPTTYEAKRRLGFIPYIAVNYRKTVPGVRGINNFLYKRLMSNILDPKNLYRF